MKILKRVKNLFAGKPSSVSRVELVSEQGNNFYSWNGQMFQSDIIRSCIRPFAKAVGKLKAKHLRGVGAELKVNPDAYIRFLLEEPNIYMTGQMFQEKLATQLKLNNNAFAYIFRDQFGYATEMYPLRAFGCEALYGDDGVLFLKFYQSNGKAVVFPYSDIIHLRQDYSDNDIFGASPLKAIEELMDVVVTTDLGMVNAIKNSGVIRWLLRFSQQLQPEDMKANVELFNNAFLDVGTANGGAAGVDSKVAEIKQVEPRDYVPNSSQMTKAINRIYNFFGTNENIIQGKYTENEWLAYYESEIEPIAIQLSNELTRKIFSRKERSFNNKIVLEGASLQYASMQTKLNLMQMVDRGAMTPNEWREVMNLAPKKGGEDLIRRLDTAVVKEGGDDNV